MLKLTIPLLFVAVTMVIAIPRGGPPRGPPGGGMQGIDPNMRKVIIDMIMAQISQVHPNFLMQQLMGKLPIPPTNQPQKPMGNFGGFKPPKAAPQYQGPPPNFHNHQYQQHKPIQQQQPIHHMPPHGGNVYQRNQYQRALNQRALNQRALNQRALNQKIQYQRYLQSRQPQTQRTVQRFKQLLRSRQQTTVMPNHNPPMRPAPMRIPHQQRPAPAPANNGLLMDIPRSHGGHHHGHHHGYSTGYGGGGFFSGSYCPPGPVAMFGSDNCKDKIIFEALYNKQSGKPLYSWVPPSNPRDPYSISDNVKDQAMHILIQKVMSSPTKKATNKQKDLMRALGDPPNHVKPMFGMMYY